MLKERNVALCFEPKSDVNRALKTNNEIQPTCPDTFYFMEF